MISPLLLHEYQNGNCNVKLYADGTKVREYEGTPMPVHPESMDVKITNQCDLGCSFCHERSTPKGKHADIGTLLEVLKPLPAGVEIAIGGGNPLSHPELPALLQSLHKQGLVANITVNLEHAKQYDELLYHMQQLGHIHGLGISVPAGPTVIPQQKCFTANTVFHLIAGVNPVAEVYRLKTLCEKGCIPCKILVLGYKNYGRGARHYQTHITSTTLCHNDWHDNLDRLFQLNGLTLSFDNLALQQLRVQRHLSEDQWDEFFMGDDGTFTMYVDTVKQVFAKSSTSTERVPFAKSTLLNYFKSLQQSV